MVLYLILIIKEEEDAKNIARVRNCPDIAILNSRFGLCLFVFLSFCLFFVFFLSFFVFLFLHLFFFLSRHHFDPMSEGSDVSKVTLCVETLKWQSVTESVTKVRYRAARAAKKAHPVSV